MLYSYKERPAGNVCRPAIYGSYSIACKGAFVTPIKHVAIPCEGSTDDSTAPPALARPCDRPSPRSRPVDSAFAAILATTVRPPPILLPADGTTDCGIGPTNATEMAILTELTEAGAGNTEESAGDESTASSVEGRASPKKTKPKSRRASILSLPEQKDRDEMVEDGPDE